MKVFVLLESKRGREMQVAGVYATRSAAGEAVINSAQELGEPERYCFEVHELEVKGAATEPAYVVWDPAWDAAWAAAVELPHEK
jgi:hypothetical protein